MASCPLGPEPNEPDPVQADGREPRSLRSPARPRGGGFSARKRGRRVLVSIAGDIRHQAGSLSQSVLREQEGRAA